MELLQVDVVLSSECFAKEAAIVLKDDASLCVILAEHLAIVRDGEQVVLASTVACL